MNGDYRSCSCAATQSRGRRERNDAHTAAVADGITSGRAEQACWHREATSSSNYLVHKGYRALPKAACSLL